MGSGVLGMLLAGVMHYRSWGYENMFPGRRVHKATMHRKHLPPKLWRPKDQPAPLAQSIKFPLKKIKSWIKKKTVMTVNYDLIREEELCFFFFQKKKGKSCWHGYSYVGWTNSASQPQKKRSTDRVHKTVRVKVGTRLWPQDEKKKWHPLCISSYLKITRIHFCGIQYVMSYDLYVLYCSYSSL